MSKKYKDDEHLYAHIQNGDDKVLKQLFTEYWTPFRLFIIKYHSLPDDKVWDIYCESFTVFVLNIRDGKLELPLNSQLKTYLFGIGRKYVLKYFDGLKRKKEDHYPDDDQVFSLDLEPDILKVFELNWQKDLVRKLLEKVGESCRKILELTFIEDNSDEAIAEKMKIASTGAVRQKRFNCLNKLRTLVRQGRE